MKITFVLPCLGNIPIGGLKVVYEYANYLSERGHTLNVIHPITMDLTYSFYRKAQVYKWFLLRKLDRTYRPDNWFNIHSNVNIVLVPYLSEKYIPNADFIIATAWDTAEPTAKFSNKKGKKYYFIQNFEIWAAKKEQVLRTFRLPMKKIVISDWLKRLVNSQKEDAYYIPNGFNFNAFGIDIQPENRDNETLMMLYHKLNAKGSIIGLRAIKKAKRIIPKIKLIMFSAYPSPNNLPDWVNYFYKPEQLILRKLYNKSAIFISPSFLEGFPLPPAEAMMSGSALLASDIGGHREYAIHNETALLYPPKDVNTLVERIVELIGDRHKRIHLATQGNSFIKQFTWERATNTMENILKNDL